MTIERIYTGLGGAGATKTLPTLHHEDLTDPRDYLAPPDLAAAVDVALILGMPLLLTGEPGSGKSALAGSIAHELRLGRAPQHEALTYAVKSNTEARDLFYTFDTVGRFHASQVSKAAGGADARHFITFQALGRALLHAKDHAFSLDTLGLPVAAVEHPGKPVRSVVLIDEIDKAPRDVPNDILVEIESMAFEIPELAATVGEARRIQLDRDSDEAQRRPLVIFTSNREQSLPEPFLRRCVFHHLAFPPFSEGEGDTRVTVERIVGRRLGKRYAQDNAAIRRTRLAISFFSFVRAPERERQIGRRPTLAELLNWLDFLMPPKTPNGPADWHALAALEQNDDSPSFRLLLGSIDSLLLKRPLDTARGTLTTATDLFRAWRDLPEDGATRTE